MSEKKTKRGTATAPAAAGAARGFHLGTGAAAIVLALITILFFHDVFLGGKTFVSSDAAAPAGFARIGEHSLYKEHVYPLWNPFVFLGMPSFGSGTYNPLIYPPDWPLALVAKVIPLPDMTWLLLYYFLGGLFLFLLAREWGARAEAALLGAVAFVFAPNLVAVGAHGHGSQLVDSAYLPLLVWLASRWLRRGRLADFGWLALAGGFQLLRGHVQICFYSWLAIAILTVVDLAAGLRDPAERGTRVMRAAGIALAAALAFGVSAFYSLPLRDYARWSIRGGDAGGAGLQYATAWSLSFGELLTIVIPGFMGYGGETYWGGMPFTDYPNAYVGLITILFAIPVFFAARRVELRLRLFALALAVFALFVAFGHNSPLYGFLYAHLPLFNKFRIPVMVLVLFQLASALALAWGWTAVLDAGDARAAAPRGAKTGSPFSRFFPTSAALLLVALFAAMASSGFHDAYVRTAIAGHPNFPPEAAEAAFRGFVTDLGRGAALGLLAIGAGWLAAKRTIPATLASAIVLVLLLVEILPVSGRVMAPVIGDLVPHDENAGRDDVVQFLETQGPSGSFRILPLGERLPNRYASFSIASIEGYPAAKPRLFQDFQDARLETNPAWLRLLNVRFLVAPQPMEGLPPVFHQVFQGSQVVYENLFVLPRATLVDRYRVVQPDSAIVDSVSAGSSDAALVTFLGSDPGMEQGHMGRAEARVTSYRLNEVTVTTSTQGPAILRLADLWYPDWVATVDGRTAPILRADKFLRAVVVPAGRHEVKFTFRSPAMRQGLTISIVSALIAIASIVAGSLTRPRTTTEPERAAA